MDAYKRFTVNANVWLDPYTYYIKVVVLTVHFVFSFFWH